MLIIHKIAIFKPFLSRAVSLGHGAQQKYPECGCTRDFPSFTIVLLLPFYFRPDLVIER
jgi:hypothetical protein